MHRLVASLPGQFGIETQRWVQVLRGHGRRRHPAQRWATIRSYLTRMHPTLLRWSGEMTSLREVTGEQVKAVLKEVSARRAHGLATALRSLFRALKQERLVFTDPTQGVRVAYVDSLALPLPGDRLTGLVEQVEPASSKLLVAFLAVHALTSRDIRLIRLDDIDLPRARITLRRTPRPHTIFLDPLTYRLLTTWLQERRRRWPLTHNRYLIINLHTAVDDRCPPIATEAIRDRLQPTGLLPNRLRTDRILHEAAVTADPVHLIRLFGVSAKTAMRYLRSAHPERGAVIPR